MYWSAKDVPELRDLSAAERQRLVRKYRWTAYKQWQVWLLGLPVSLAMYFAAAQFGLVGVLVGGTLGLAAIEHFKLSALRPYFRRELEEPPPRAKRNRMTAG